MRLKLLFSAVVILFILSGCNSKDAKNSAQTVSKNDPQSQQTLYLQSVDGKKLKVKKTKNGFNFKGFENKIVLLNFFATWCPPCKAEIPHLISLQNKFKNNFAIIAVSMDENMQNEEMKSFINYHGINYTVTNGENNFQMASLTGGVKSIPLMIMYDKEGNYFTHYVGAVPEEMIEADIKKVLGTK
jgi:thiol-disulfide isomerase/thioredoxin